MPDFADWATDDSDTRKMTARKLYWVELNRFDSKPDKSTWLEVGEVLARSGFDAHIVTSYNESRYIPVANSRLDVVSLKPSKIPGLFRVALLFSVARFLRRNADPKNSIIMVSPAGLWLMPLLFLAGFRHWHLDVRTVPVTIHGLKKKFDQLVFWNWALRIFFGRVQSVSYITTGIQDQVEQIAGRKARSSCLWSSGVNLQLFDVSPIEKSDSEPYEFYYHGTITQDRGIIEMVTAVALLPEGIRSNIELTIVGPGPDLPALQELVASTEDLRNVRVLGLIPYEDIPKALSTADCCISPLPSKPEWEVSSPLKVLEYMAANKPIIATRISPHRDVLSDQAFVVWTEGAEPADFARAMSDAYAARNQLATSSLVARKVVAKNYSWAAVGGHFADHLAANFGLSE